MVAERRLAPLLALACAAAAPAAGCATAQRCRATPWLEVEQRRRVDVLPGIGWGEDGASVRVRAAGRWVETERHAAVAGHVTPDAVVLLVLEGPGGAAREAHVYRQGVTAPVRIDLAACPRPLLLADDGTMVCSSCAGGEPEDPAEGCAAETFTELDLEGAVRGERTMQLPMSAAGGRCHVEELYGLSAGREPVVRVACPAPAAARAFDPWIRADVELRADGFTEVAPRDLPRPRTSLPWLDGQCPRWASGPVPAAAPPAR